MSELAVGQVLWLKIRFNNNGDVSNIEHPYLILDIDDGVKLLEVGQMDSLKPYKLIYRSNKPIYITNPNETVLTKDSYIQLDNQIQIEYFDDLKKFRKTEDTLSQARLAAILTDYKEYRENHIISPEKSVYLTKSEIMQYNR